MRLRQAGLRDYERRCITRNVHKLPDLLTYGRMYPPCCDKKTSPLLGLGESELRSG